MSVKNQIKKAVGDHGTWKKKLKLAIKTGTIDCDIAALESDCNCNFGKWLYGSSITSKERNSAHYQKVRELHAAFHEKASKVARLDIAGHKTDATKMLDANGEFTAASATLTTSMIAWLQEANVPQKRP